MGRMNQTNQTSQERPGGPAGLRGTGLRGTGLRNAEDLLQYEKTLDCVHCGLCLAACPTYEQHGREGTGPRGRIYLMRGLAEESIEPTPEVTRDLDLCLVCRACEPVCPSGVQFAEMMEFVRSDILAPARPRTMGGRIQRLFLTRLVGNQRLLRLVFWSLSVYQRSGLRTLLRRYGTLKYLSPDLDLRDQLLPEIPSRRDRRRLPSTFEARSTRRGRVALLEGCVAPILLGPVNHSTARLLAEQGFDVAVPARRTCCGALGAHFGELESARIMARQTVRAFTRLGPVDAVLVNSAGCGALMKEYGRLMAEWGKASDADRRAAAGFASKVRDVSEFLVEEGIRRPSGRVDAKVAYADACHLAHAQGVADAPRALLDSIPGLERVELDRADRCCGAGGLYNALHPRESQQLLEGKIADLKRSGATILATANPGCLLQWRSGIEQHGLDIEVVHPVELADRAAEPGC